MGDEKTRNLKKVIRKPANICRIDNSFTAILIEAEVESMPMGDKKTGKDYLVIRKGNGLQVIGR